MAEYKASSPNTELLRGMIYSLLGAFPEGFQALVKKGLVKNTLPISTPLSISGRKPENGLHKAAFSGS